MCEVVIAGRATGKVLPGAVFETALRWHDYVLLFVTDDVVFEEGLTIYLLDQHLNVVDSAKIYRMYSTGIFSGLDLSEDDSICFNFLGDLVWKLRLYNDKKFAIPLLSSPMGLHRPWTFFRRFEISRVNQRTAYIAAANPSAIDPAELK